MISRKTLQFPKPKDLKKNTLEDVQKFFDLIIKELDKQYRLLWQDSHTIQTDIDVYIYFGGKETDGSWRIGRDGDDLVYQLRVAGVWVDTGIKLGADGSVTILGVLVTESGRIAHTNRITANTVLDETYHKVFCNGTFTVSLPTGIEGTSYVIKNSGTGVITVDPDGTEEIFQGGAGIAAILSSGEVIDIDFNTIDGWH